MSIILNISLSSEEKEKGERGRGKGRSDFLFFCGVKYEFANFI